MATNNKDFKVKNGLQVNGAGVFVGTVSVATPTAAEHAATKEYVDTNSGGGVTISDNPPTNPNAGDQWYNSADGVLYVYYDGFWVESSSGGQEISFPGSANQIIYKDGSNIATGSSGLTYNGTDLAISSGKISVNTSAGDEGGEIFLASPATNTTISGGVTIDVYQNKLRFFEQGGSARGYSIDMTSGAAGAGTLIGGPALTVNDVARINGWLDGTIEPRSRTTQILNATVASGVVNLIHFTPVTNITVSQIAMASSGTPASGLTLARMGVYQINNNAGTSATLIARTANDTTLFTNPSTVYTRSFDTAGGYPSSLTLTAGTRYALAHIVVGTTTGNRVGYQTPSANFMSDISPRASSTLTGQTDLPTSSTGLQSTTLVIWGRLS